MKPITSITYGKEFSKKKFTADTMKSAYMKAVKWNNRGSWEKCY